MIVFTPLPLTAGLPLLLLLYWAFADDTLTGSG